MFYGLILFIDIIRIWNIELVESFYPRGIVFPYTFLNLPLPEYWVLKLVIVLMGISALLIAFGICFRMAMSSFLVLFCYFFFLDQTLYNNHLYLIILLGLILLFSPAGKSISIPNIKKYSSISFQWLILIRSQIIIVYFFGGIAKLNHFWLNGFPVDKMLTIRAKATGMEWLNSLYMEKLIVWGGLSFDLLIGFLLLYRPTRVFAIIGAILFNIFNAFLFDDIFIFPFFMTASLILFLDQERLEALFKSFGFSETGSVKAYNLTWPITIYLIWQLIMPIRHYFIKGYADWTGDCQQFSWRMKIQARAIEKLDFYLVDEKRGDRQLIELNRFLYQDEISRMSERPQMMILFAKFVEQKLKLQSPDFEFGIYSDIQVEFNSLKYKKVFPENLDLLEVSAEDYMHKWVLPLRQNESN